MSKCENCIHYDVCAELMAIHKNQTIAFVKECIGKTNGCIHFKDKSLFVELNCEVGDVIHLIDKEFVNKALINELSKMAYENEEKKAKEMGFIRVKPNLPKPHKPHTKEEEEQKLKELEE